MIEWRQEFRLQSRDYCHVADCVEIFGSTLKQLHSFEVTGVEWNDIPKMCDFFREAENLQRFGCTMSGKRFEVNNDFFGKFKSIKDQNEQMTLLKQSIEEVGNIYLTKGSF